MEYRRIDENTIRFILTEDDLEEYGLDLDSFLSKSSGVEPFLRHCFEEAREETGYQLKHGVVSMRIEVLPDRRIALTVISGDTSTMLQQIHKHLGQLFPDLPADVIKNVLHNLEGLPEEERRAKMKELLADSVSTSLADNKQSTEENNEIREEEPYRVISFTSLSDVISFAVATGSSAFIRSHLYKLGEFFYLVLDKYRIADERYNRYCAIAFDYGYVETDALHVMEALKKDGQLLIEDRAIMNLRRL